ncbi:MAG: hypothetical protein HOQ05_14355 [Corynebacteriales bacterium]|nr:hypothetical protein [Mycobacteriales bacterium]
MYAPQFKPQISAKELKPGRGWFVVAAAIFVLSLIAAVVTLVVALTSLPDIDIKFDDEETKVVELDSDKRYTLYVDTDRSYSVDYFCSVTSVDTGDAVELSDVDTEYTQGKWSSIYHFDVPRDGDYDLLCNGTSERNRYALGERANLWVLTAGITGLFVLPGLGFLIGGVIALVVAVKRNRHKTRLLYQRHYEYYIGQQNPGH